MRGGFTLPGEAGYEKLTLELAARWDADMIRDSDGTKLSDELLRSGLGVYSTLCPIREHNDWIRRNPHARQQVFLSTSPVVARGGEVEIELMADFFSGQFEINDEALSLWQVYDRTMGLEVPRGDWRYDSDTGCVTVQTIPFREYSASFLAWRVWEEISMYNHVTNNWQKERLMQLDPYLPEAREYLRGWMKKWLDEHPDTKVVRFTSLFYNFTWIWGSSKRNRSIFTDWASYDFTVSPAALDDFAVKYGYSLTAEDFVNKGKYRSTHAVPNRQKLDWMEFIGGFVCDMARELVGLVHERGKLAYVFYDDSWVGMEPYGPNFSKIGFDGIIKCVFSGFEARLCAGVPVKTHELRFHPYLFPVGLGGAPTFSPGGRPGLDALCYWSRVRRALLIQKVERAGLGGYLHLAKGYPDFIEAMDQILAEFRLICDMRDMCQNEKADLRVGILTAWGKLRSWTLSGHMHETDAHPLIHVIESLSGLPFDVRFLSFEDVLSGGLEGLDALICAGAEGTSWSGGEKWGQEGVVEAVTKWTHDGGAFIGIGEPSALAGGARTFRMAQVLGVDRDDASYACHGAWQSDTYYIDGLSFDPERFKNAMPVRVIDAQTKVLCRNEKGVLASMRPFGSGVGVYLVNHQSDPIGTRLFEKLLRYAVTKNADFDGETTDPMTESRVLMGAGKIVLSNLSAEAREAKCSWAGKSYSATLAPYEMRALDL